MIPWQVLHCWVFTRTLRSTVLCIYPDQKQDHIKRTVRKSKLPQIQRFECLQTQEVTFWLNRNNEFVNCRLVCFRETGSAGVYPSGHWSRITGCQYITGRTHHSATHTHAHLESPINLMYIFLHKRKQEYLDKTKADMGENMKTPHLSWDLNPEPSCYWQCNHCTAVQPPMIFIST